MGMHGYQPIASLALDYAMLRRYLGELRFNAMTSNYMAATTLQHTSARLFTAGLPEFLSNSTSFAPELVELATLERALHNAFIAVEADSVNSRALADLSLNTLNSRTFRFHPALQLLVFRQNTTSLWSAMRCEESPPRPCTLAAPQHVMVWRQKHQPRMRMVGIDEHQALCSARDGATFGAICTLLQRDHSEDPALRATTYLQGWLEAEIVADVNSAQPMGHPSS